MAGAERGTFDVWFSKPKFRISSRTSVWTGSLRLAGRGTLELGDSEIHLTGRRGFLRARRRSTLQLDGVVDVEQVGNALSFKGWLTSDEPARFAIWTRDAASAKAIADALPRAQTEKFARELAEKKAFAAKIPPAFAVTYTLIGINLAIGIALIRKFGLAAPDPLEMIDLGSNWGPAVNAGEWWRFLTSIFLHYGLAHLAFNMWALGSVGPLVERLYGSWRFSVIYLLSGLLGSLATSVASPSVNSVGASGAIFGLYGAYLAHVIHKRAQVPASLLRERQITAVIFVIANLVLGAVTPNIANSAHVGGLLGGFAIGWLLVRTRDETARAANVALRFVAIAALALSALGLDVASAHWRGPDFANEQRFRLAIVKVLAEQQSYDGLLKSKPLEGTRAAMGARVERELIPFFDRMEQDLETPDLAAESSMHEVQQLARNYVQIKHEGLEQLAIGYAESDPAASAEGERLLTDASKLSKRLSAELER